MFGHVVVAVYLTVQLGLVNVAVYVMTSPCGVSMVEVAGAPVIGTIAMFLILFADKVQVRPASRDAGGAPPGVWWAETHTSLADHVSLPRRTSCIKRTCCGACKLQGWVATTRSTRRCGYNRCSQWGKPSPGSCRPCLCGHEQC